MKKCSMIAVAALLSVLPLAAQAQPSSHTDNLRSNFYAGGYGGYGWTNADFSGSPTVDVNGVDYGAFAGFEVGQALKPVGLQGGLEFHYGWSNADGRRGTNSVEKDHEWGISLRPGLTFMSDHMPLDLKPYGILGYRRTQFDNVGAGTGSDWHNGFELGLGSELVAFSNVGTRLDYTHVFFKQKSGLDPSEDDLRLGAAIHF
jgi:opacity protein-like surface antigen